MRILTVLLLIATGIAMSELRPANAENVYHSPKSALSRCIAKAKKKKGAFARNKAIRACLNRKR